MIIPDSCKDWIKKQRTRAIDFELEMIEEYRTIKSYLPDKCENILDVGCGVGGIDVYLSNHFKFPPNIYLFDFMDQEYGEKIKYGFNDEYHGYNNMVQTMIFMKANRILNYHYVDASKGFPLHLTDVDLIISLLSWGYHYPVETYIDRALPIMSDNGIMIIDVRQGTDGIKTLENYFKDVKIIKSANKADKVIASNLKY